MIGRGMAKSTKHWQFWCSDVPDKPLRLHHYHCAWWEWREVKECPFATLQQKISLNWVHCWAGYGTVKLYYVGITLKMPCTTNGMTRRCGEPSAPVTSRTLRKFNTWQQRGKREPWHCLAKMRHMLKCWEKKNPHQETQYHHKLFLKAKWKWWESKSAIESAGCKRKIDVVVLTFMCKGQRQWEFPWSRQISHCI